MSEYANDDMWTDLDRNEDGEAEECFICGCEDKNICGHAPATGCE